jgi:hypothetical protein
VEELAGDVEALRTIRERVMLVRARLRDPDTGRLL